MEAKVNLPCIYQPTVQCRYYNSSTVDTDRVCSECELYDHGIIPTLEKKINFIQKIKNLFRSQKIKDLELLNSYLALYVKLLQEENRELIKIISKQNWKLTEEQIKTGSICRQQITKLTKKIYPK